MAEFPTLLRSAVSLSAVALVAVLSAAPARAQDEGDDETVPERDGRALYVERCANCHGETGDGRGPLTLALGQPARDFAAGGFAFGNTPEAMFRTVTSGIPGRSPMPGFRDVLTEEERWKVVEYVRTLMPKEAIADPAVTVLRVPKDRPIVARGPLPPIAEGLPIRPRGLLVGLPEGLTFEYRIDDVRLLAVRQGEFADRPDWNGRGGDFLKPLGVPIYKFGGGDPPAPFSAMKDGERVPLEAKLVETLAKKDTAIVRYEFVGNGGSASEWLTAQPLSVGPAFTRSISASIGSTPLFVTLAGSTPEAKWVAEIPDGKRNTWVVSERDGVGFECVRVTRRASIGSIVKENGWLGVEVLPAAGPHPSVPNVVATTVVVANWTPELLAQLSQEIDR